HQQNVDQRGHVDIGSLSTTTATSCHCHRINPLLPVSCLLLRLRRFVGVRVRVRVLPLFGQQTHLVNTGGADIVPYVHHRFVLGARVSPDKHFLVGLALHAVLDLLREFFC